MDLRKTEEVIGRLEDGNIGLSETARYYGIFGRTPEGESKLAIWQRRKLGPPGTLSFITWKAYTLTNRF